MNTEIFLIDKNAVYAGSIASLLSKNYDKDIEVFNSLEAMPEKSAHTKRIVIYLINGSAETDSSYENIKEKKHALAFDYIIVLSKVSSIKSAIQFIRAGAIDYINIDELSYSRLDDTLTNLFKVMSVKEIITTLDTRLGIRSKQLIGSISLTILLITLVFLMF